MDENIMGRTESSLGTDTVKLVHEVGVPVVWAIVEGVPVTSAV